MSFNVRHRNLGRADNHPFISYVFVDAAARAAAVGFDPADQGRAALQLSDGTFWALATTAPPTWSQLGSVGGAIAGLIDPTKAPYGAVGDGVTDATAAINNAIIDAHAARRWVYLPDGTFLVTVVTNAQGVRIIGPGRIVKAVTGGTQQLSSYADTSQYIFGREYLSHYHKMALAGTLSTMVFSGDSTTVQADTPEYVIDRLMYRHATSAGVNCNPAVNRGQSGKTTHDWVTTYLAGDLAANPDVLVIRWGINDAVARTIDQFATDLRSGLATIRASKTLAQLSIVLCTPNSTSDTPNNRDEKWYEQVYEVVKQAARDYQCVFVDIYGYLRDSRNAADWMDDPYADGRHIHPQNVMNAWISGLLADAMFPRGLAAMLGSTTMNVSGNITVPSAAAAPATYPMGVSIMRAWPASGWPKDGAVYTIRHCDGIVLQYNWSYANATVDVQVRQSNGSAWTAWAAA